MAMYDLHTKLSQLIGRSARVEVLREVADERGRQDDRFGEQNHPDGTSKEWESQANYYRVVCDREHRAGKGNWLHILLEEVFEAASEEDPAKLRDELVQVTAVAVNWIEAIDRRVAEVEADLAASPWPGT